MTESHKVNIEDFQEQVHDILNVVLEEFRGAHPELFKKTKWIVKSKNKGHSERDHYVVLWDAEGMAVSKVENAEEVDLTVFEESAFKFDTKEQAEQFSNPLLEVVEWEG